MSELYPVHDTNSPIGVGYQRIVDNIHPTEDDRSLALAPNGGGVKSVVALGSLLVLSDEGFVDIADMHVGASGGGIVATAAACDQIPMAYDLFKDLAGQNVITPKGLIPFNGQPLLDLRRLGQKTLDIGLDLESIDDHVGLYIGLTDLQDMNPFINRIRANTPQEEAVRTLMRSSHFPILAGPPEIDESSGLVWGDGGMSWVTTAQIAREMGATSIIEIHNTVLSGNSGSDAIELSLVDRGFKRMVELWLLKHVGIESVREYGRFIDSQRKIWATRNESDVDQIGPYNPKGKMPGIATRSPETVANGFEEGKKAAQLALGFEVEGVGYFPRNRRLREHMMGSSRNASVFAMS